MDHMDIMDIVVMEIKDILHHHHHKDMLLNKDNQDMINMVNQDNILQQQDNILQHQDNILHSKDMANNQVMVKVIRIKFIKY